MSPDPPAPGTRARLAEAWRRHGRVVRGAGVIYLAVAAGGRLHYALPHLLRDVAPWSALDLKYRFNEVAQWFAGNPVYGVVDGAVYPPASHAILWPLLGWATLDTARVLWAVTTFAAALALGLLLYRLADPAPPRDRLLVAGLALAAYPLQLSVFVGQMGVHVAALAACGALLLFVKRPRWSTDGLAAALLACSLVKPTLSLPLVVAASIASRRARPALLVVAVYAAVTLVAAAYQPAGLLTLFRGWLAVAGERVPFMDGVPNLHMLLWWAGLGSWMTPASLLVLAATAAWTWWQREAPPWVLMGVAGIVARLWAHSTAYDDAFLLLPAVALFQIAYGPAARGRRFAGGLFAAVWAALLTPTWAFYDLPPVLVWSIHGTQTVLWMAVLGFLVVITGSRPSPSTPAPAPPDRVSLPWAPRPRPPGRR